MSNGENAMTVEKTLLEIKKDLAEKKISSLEATEATLAQIEAKADLGSYVTVCADEARAAAKEADARIAAGRICPCSACPWRSRTIYAPRACAPPARPASSKTTCRRTTLSS